MRYLMGTHRTWACVYNIQSWCCYSTSSHACYAQDSALESPAHELCLEYRDLEVRLFQALDGPRRSPAVFQKVVEILAAKRKKVLTFVTAKNLACCAFYPYYRQLDRKAVINKTDPNIPRLLSAGHLQRRGCSDRAP